MKYPQVLSESDTLAFAEEGGSLSRFGDGELRLVAGGDCISQREKSPALMAELGRILREPAPENCLVCIPNALSRTPKAESWRTYTEAKYVRFYGQPSYGSAFITRPDSAPWIDTGDYWQRVRALWRGRQVFLCSGGKNGLRPDALTGASSVVFIEAPEKNAYSSIDRLEREIRAELDNADLTPEPLVILCVGVTATCLAYRLVKDVQALDLGHIGMFMKHAGAYRYTADDLVSPAYRRQLQKLHKSRKWGHDGEKHVAQVKALLGAIDGEKVTILDYGCGGGELAKALGDGVRVAEYDPGIPGKDKMPKPADLVVSTDVLEHVEPELLGNVLDHLVRLTGRMAYLVINLRPANAHLPDGRNAHLSLLTPTQWYERFQELPVKVRGFDDRGKELRVILERQ